MKEKEAQLKEKVNPILSLDLVPIKDLEGSNFLETLIELSFLSCPLKPILSEDTKVPLISQEEKTRYSIKDFYEGALPLWPGQISQSAKSQTARS